MCAREDLAAQRGGFAHETCKVHHVLQLSQGKGEDVSITPWMLKDNECTAHIIRNAGVRGNDHVVMEQPYQIQLNCHKSLRSVKITRHSDLLQPASYLMSWPNARYRVAGIHGVRCAGHPPSL